MKLYTQLDAQSKSPEENWAILNKAERQITIRRADATTTLLTGQIAFHGLAVLLPYALLLALGVARGSQDETIVALRAAFPLTGVLEGLTLPWYILVPVAVAALFAVPWLLALLAKGVTLLIATHTVKEKTAPLPADAAACFRALTERTEKLYQRQYHSNGPDILWWFALGSTILFALLPLLTLLLGGDVQVLLQDMMASMDVTPAVGWLMAIVNYLLTMGLAALGYFLLACGLSLAFDKIHSPLYYGRHWHLRCQALSSAGQAFRLQWGAVDPEERARQEEAAQKEEQRWQEKKRQDEELLRSMALSYAREQREAAEYRERLHQWATGDDDPADWRGSGDGI